MLFNNNRNRWMTLLRDALVVPPRWAESDRERHSRKQDEEWENRSEFMAHHSVSLAPPRLN
jgi:hypothetical protein